MNKRISKYLLLLICGCLLFTACRVLEATWEIPKAIGESLGIIEPEEKTEGKVVNGKVVKVIHRRTGMIRAMKSIKKSTVLFTD